jgi:hypothetical protein
MQDLWLFAKVVRLIKTQNNKRQGIQEPASQCEGLGSFPGKSLYGIGWLSSCGTDFSEYFTYLFPVPAYKRNTLTYLSPNTK